MLRLLRMAIAAGAIGIIAGCSSNVPASPSSVSPSSLLPAGADCVFLDLRTPTGARVDLTGTWRGNDDAYYSFYQSGNCLWATGTSAHAVLTLRGTLMNDLTVPVEFAIVACVLRAGPTVCGRTHGTDLLTIEEGSDGGDIVLQAVGVINDPGQGSGIRVTRWSRVSETPLFPPPTPGV